MTPESFCYWLQGFFELQDPKEIDPQQVDIIKNHLNLVFLHSIDPKATVNVKNKEVADKIQNLLTEIHKPMDFPKPLYTLEDAKECGKHSPYPIDTTLLRC